MVVAASERATLALHRNRSTSLPNSENSVNQRHGLLVQWYDAWLASEAITVRGHRLKVGGRRSTDNDGLMVQRDDTALAWRPMWLGRCEFNSRWVH